MNTSIESRKEELLNSMKRIEQAEVILSNLLHLHSVKKDSFTIPHDDVVVTIQTALELLESKKI